MEQEEFLAEELGKGSNYQNGNLRCFFPIVKYICIHEKYSFSRGNAIEKSRDIVMEQTLEVVFDYKFDFDYYQLPIN